MRWFRVYLKKHKTSVMWFKWNNAPGGEVFTVLWTALNNAPHQTECLHIQGEVRPQVWVQSADMAVLRSTPVPTDNHRPVTPWWHPQQWDIKPTIHDRRLMYADVWQLWQIWAGYICTCDHYDIWERWQQMNKPLDIWGCQLLVTFVILQLFTRGDNRCIEP